MLSAVENFGPASAAAAHPYARHNPYAIAAAAAAAGSAAAVAAAVIPSQPHHTNNQSSMEHYTIAGHLAASNHSHHLVTGGLFLPPPPPHLPLPISILSSKSSPQELKREARDRSQQRHPSDAVNVDSSMSVQQSAMSSTEFARPHPKQPRYATNNTSINNNNNNNNSVSGPQHMRPNKNGINVNNCLNNNNNSNVNNNNLMQPMRSKYSSEQSGPVNLVTNNNSNSNNDHTQSHHAPPTPPHMDSRLISQGNNTNRKAMEADNMVGMYAPSMPFTAANAVSNAAAAAAASFQFSYPHHMYPTRALYGPSALYPSHHQLGVRRPSFMGEHPSAQFPSYLPQPVGYSQTSVPHSTPQPTEHGNIVRPMPSQSQSSQIRIPHSRSPGSHEPSRNHMPHNDRPALGRIASDSDLKPYSGTYLNGKVNNSPAAPESVSGFKVPSGKEGSLKHRILTRPANSSCETRKSPISTTIVRTNGSNGVSTNFSKGAVIEVANGVLRRVEDMRTEDFIQSAKKSPIHQLADSTVVKITASANTVIITFSYHENRSKADVEVNAEHPFFVYGQGWASCNPEMSLQTFGLKCQRLQVGDVCISLMLRENASSNGSTTPKSQASPNSTTMHKVDHLQVPQNLSRKSQSSTVLTTATGTTVSSRPYPHHLMPPIHTHMTYGIGDLHPYAADPHSAQISSRHDQTAIFSNGLAPSPSLLSVPPQQNHFRLVGSKPSFNIADGHFIHSGNGVNTSKAPSPPIISISPPSQHQRSYYLGANRAAVPVSSDAGVPEEQMTSDEQPMDASLSRKRRWSAPDNICDDENDCSQQAPQSANKTPNL